MASTYTAISSVSNNSVSSITFSNIPSTYTELCLVLSGFNTSLSSLSMLINNISTTSYGWVRLFGSGTGNAGLTQGYASNAGLFGVIDSGQGFTEIWFPGYKDTVNNKGYVAKSYTQQGWTGVWAGNVDTTAAITSINLFSAPNPGAGSVATLYGVLA